jgi:hypothetical protein
MSLSLPALFSRGVLHAPVRHRGLCSSFARARAYVRTQAPVCRALSRRAEEWTLDRMAMVAEAARPRRAACPASRTQSTQALLRTRLSDTQANRQAREVWLGALHGARRDGGGAWLERGRT